MTRNATLQNQWREMVAWLDRCPAASACPFHAPDLTGLAMTFDLAKVKISAEPSPDWPTVEPSLANATDEILGLLQADLAKNPEDARLAAWCEKLLRTCELRRADLERLIRQPGQSSHDGRRRALQVCLLLLDFFRCHGDARCVNLVLKLLDEPWLSAALTDRPWPAAPSPAGWLRVMVTLVHGLVENALQCIGQSDWRVPAKFSSAQRLAPPPQLPMANQFEDDEAPGVVVFSPSPYSLYTLSVLELLVKHGVCVQGIAVRRLLNRKRFIQEFRRDGTRLLKKIWRKLVLRRRAYVDRDYATLPQYLADIGNQHRNVHSWAKAHHVPAWRCRTLNDESIVAALHQHQPRLVIFTGGGLIRETILKASGAGVVNTHMGPLPPYRGMDVVEWPILEGHPDQVGLTVHFMVKGLDEGPILVMHHVPRDGTRDIVQLRERMEVLAPQACVQAVVQYLAGHRQAEPQVLADGRQYFIMHRRLYDLALAKYQAFRATEST